MNSNNELHVVFGTGAVGMAVMRELLNQGKRVRMVNRSGTASVPEYVEVVKANAADPAHTRDACRGATVVYNCVNAPYTDWAELLPPMHTAIIHGAAVADAKLVVAENLYMYGPVSGSITEERPFQPTTRKGRVRAKLSEDLMAAHRAGIVRATSGRASDFYGPGAGAQGIFGDRIVPSMLAGRGVSVLGKLDMPHSYTYIEDFGKGLVILGAHDEALGQSWHIPNAPTLTTRQMLTLFFEEACLAPKMSSVPDLVVRMLGLFKPVVREVAEMLYEFNEPFVVESSKFVQAFGDIATTHRDAIRQTLEWYRSRAPATTASPMAPSDLSLARPAWRRRVARIGSLFQLGFAALWLGRGTLATGWTERLPLALTLVTGAVALGVWGEAKTRHLAPKPTGLAGRRLEREVTIASVLQLAASFVLPVVVSALGRPDLIVGAVSMTIGILLLWFRVKLRTSGHLVAGILLLAVPVGLGLVLTGNPLAAATGVAMGVILVGSALVGLSSLNAQTLEPGRSVRPRLQWENAQNGQAQPAASGARSTCFPG